MALSELALPAVFYRHKNPINCSDTAFRDAEVMMGAKVKISVFFPCLPCFSNLVPDLVPRKFDLFSSRKLG